MDDAAAVARHLASIEHLLERQLVLQQLQLELLSARAAAAPGRNCPRPGSGLNSTQTVQPVPQCPGPVSHWSQELLREPSRIDHQSPGSRKVIEAHVPDSPARSVSERSFACDDSEGNVAILTGSTGDAFLRIDPCIDPCEAHEQSVGMESGESPMDQRPSIRAGEKELMQWLPTVELSRNGKFAPRMRSKSFAEIRMPWQFACALALMCLLPPTFVSGHRLGLYKAYRIFTKASIVVYWVYNLLVLCDKVYENSFVHPEYEVLMLMYVTCSSILWLTCQRQFREHGATMMLFRQAVAQGYSLKSMKGRIVVSAVVWVGIYLFSLLSFWQFLLERYTDVMQGHDDEPWSRCLFTLHIASMLGAWCIPLLTVGLPWTVTLFSKLHEHDLLSYAAAIVAKIEECGEDDPVPMLQTLSDMVTRRLRHANRTWVRAAVWLIFERMVCCVVVIAFLYSDRSLPMFSQWIVMLMMSLAIMFTVGLPLAHVAQVFEYDVLRSLNIPLVLKNAQRHFGQQLLPHLHTLDWGFRFGGTVINMQLVTRLGGALVMAALGSMSMLITSALAPGAQ